MEVTYSRWQQVTTTSITTISQQVQQDGLAGGHPRLESASKQAGFVEAKSGRVAYLGGFAASLRHQVLGLVALIKDDETIKAGAGPVHQLL